MTALAIEAPPELIESIAKRAAELVAEQAGTPRPYLTVAEAAEYLSCKPHRLYALCSARRIPFHKDGSRTLFRPAELDEWIEAGGGVRP